jgi:hypothetical protein
MDGEEEEGVRNTTPGEPPASRQGHASTSTRSTQARETSRLGLGEGCLEAPSCTPAPPAPGAERGYKPRAVPKDPPASQRWHALTSLRTPQARETSRLSLRGGRPGTPHQAGCPHAPGAWEGRTRDAAPRKPPALRQGHASASPRSTQARETSRLGLGEGCLEAPSCTPAPPATGAERGYQPRAAPKDPPASQRWHALTSLRTPQARETSRLSLRGGRPGTPHQAGCPHAPGAWEGETRDAAPRKPPALRQGHASTSPRSTQARETSRLGLGEGSLEAAHCTPAPATPSAGRRATPRTVPTDPPALQRWHALTSLRTSQARETPRLGLGRGGAPHRGSG